MKPEEQIGPPRTLQEWLSDLSRLPGDGWLLIQQNEIALSLSTHCYPMKYSGRDLSEEEQEEFDAWLEHSRYTHFLNRGNSRKLSKTSKSKQRPTAPRNC